MLIYIQMLYVKQINYRIMKCDLLAKILVLSYGKVGSAREEWKVQKENLTIMFNWALNLFYILGLVLFSSQKIRVLLFKSPISLRL